MGRNVVFLSGAAFLCVGLAGAVSMQQQAPALNQGLRVESVAGTERTVSNTDMYFRGEYLFEIGYGFLRSDVLSVVLAVPEDLADTDTARRALTTGVSHVEHSLRLDPANAYAWQAYAEGLLALGRRSDAIEALSRSFHLAPSTPLLARRRMRMVDIVDSERSVSTELERMSQSDRSLLENER